MSRVAQPTGAIATEAAAPDGMAVTSRRERRKREVRQRIFEAGIGLFVEKGVQETTLDEIAERADVARATVYNHFAKKGDILAEWGARNRERVQHGLTDEIRARPLREQLAASLDMLAEVYEQDRRVARMIFGWSSAESLNEAPELAMIFADIVRGAQATGQARPEVDPVSVGLVLRASYFDTVLRWAIAAGDAPFDLRDALRT